MPLRILLAGAESAAIQSLRLLAGGPHQVVAVLVERADTLGAGLARAAEGLGLPIDRADRVKDPAFAGWMAEHEIDLLLNIHSLSIIHAEVARAPRIGSFNLHPGPLPAYSGMNTVTWAIARGETSHAVTLHWVDAGIDTGRIAYAARFPIGPDDTGLAVFTQCVRLGVPLVERLVADAARDPASIPAIAQVGERRVYLRRDVPADGRIDWSLPARTLHNLARASDFGPFPAPCGHPATWLDGRPLGVIGTRPAPGDCDVAPGTVAAGEDGVPLVATGDGWLAIVSVERDGRRVPGRDVLSPGARLGPEH